MIVEFVNGSLCCNTTPLVKRFIEDAYAIEGTAVVTGGNTRALSNDFVFQKNFYLFVLLVNSLVPSWPDLRIQKKNIHKKKKKKKHR